MSGLIENPCKFYIDLIKFGKIEQKFVDIKDDLLVEKSIVWWYARKVYLCLLFGLLYKSERIGRHG